jgi:HupE / UreJ protein
MNDFIFYCKEGWQHIMSLDALDHLLFILALCAIYLAKDWKKLLILITAFTIGHSITLVLSAFDVIRINASLVEFLIPCTIIVTGIFNLLYKKLAAKKVQLNYWFALFFGLIHGLGYANTIRFMLAKDQAIASCLFGFNVGLEIGQLVIVATILLLAFLFVGVLKVKQQWWVYGLSILAIIIASIIAIARIAELFGN